MGRVFCHLLFKNLNLEMISNLYPFYINLAFYKFIMIRNILLLSFVILFREHNINLSIWFDNNVCSITTKNTQTCLPIQMFQCFKYIALDSHFLLFYIASLRVMVSILYHSMILIGSIKEENTL